MIVKLLTEHHLEFLSLKGGCRDSSESTLVKMPHCWKSVAVEFCAQPKERSDKELLDKRVIPANSHSTTLRGISRERHHSSLRVQLHKEEFPRMGTLHLVSFLKSTKKPRKNSIERKR